jgi:DNA-binding MarR family transcriptional regulator
METIPHESDLSDLEQTTLLRVIVYLSMKGKASISDMKNGIHGSQGAIYRARDLLVKHKLVEKGLPEGSARRVDHWLTEKGKKFVPLIMKMTKILSEDS